MASDGELLERWRAGDAKSGDALFRRHFTSLYRFFFNKVGEDAADLVQRTFMSCVEAPDRFREESSFRTFLFVIARRRLYDHLAEAQRRGRVEDLGLRSVQELGVSFGSAIAAKREQQLLLRALRRLPLELQVMLELHYWEAMSGSELSQVLQLPEGTVRSRLRRAKKELQVQIERLANAERLDTTLDNLQRWAQEVRDAITPTERKG